MSYWGRVSNGTVVLPPEANLPEGTEVRVEPVAPKTLAERLKDVIGTVHGGDPDWAENHDHYLHGTTQAVKPLFADTFYFLALRHGPGRPSFQQPPRYRSTILTMVFHVV
ncbi:MAG: hypothetical protein ACLQOO_13570 [Terriglobia bacterium]